MTTELGPLPKFQPPTDGWDAALLVYTADQMAAERERCYALGVAAERERSAPLRAMAKQVIDADDKQELSQQMIELLRAALMADACAGIGQAEG